MRRNTRTHDFWVQFFTNMVLIWYWHVFTWINMYQHLHSHVSTSLTKTWGSVASYRTCWPQELFFVGSRMPHLPLVNPNETFVFRPQQTGYLLWAGMECSWTGKFHSSFAQEVWWMRCFFKTYIIWSLTLVDDYTWLWHLKSRQCPTSWNIVWSKHNITWHPEHDEGMYRNIIHYQKHMNIYNNVYI